MTEKTRLVAVAAAVAALAVGVMLWLGSDSTDSASTPKPELVSQGAVVYARHCQVCHGAAGQGGTGPALAGDLSDRFPDVADQRAVILLGPKSMPSFANRLTDNEIDAVIAFTRTGL